MGGLAKYNLNIACAYYYIIERNKEYDDKDKSKKNKKMETNFGLMPNTKKTT